MTEIHMSNSKTCFICGETSRFMRVTTMEVDGSPDLDFRPHDMRRLLLEMYYEKCPHCGYVNKSIENADVSPDYINSSEYKELEGAPFKHGLFGHRLPPIAVDLYRVHLIAKRKGDVQAAFNALLRAAWACDDHRDKTAAIFRRESLVFLDQFDDEMSPSGEKRIVVRADVMRRAGMFSEVVEEYSNVKLEDSMFDRLLAFEVSRAAQNDGKRYTITQARKS